MALIERVDGLLHEATQVHDGGIDLSVAGVAVVDEPGRVDFGGGELTDAGVRYLGTETRDPDDDYGWWNLAPGTYLIEFNEFLTGEGPVRLEPRAELVARGGTHPTLTVDSLPRVPLRVADSTGDGPAIKVKENARVSTIRPL